MPEFLTLDGLAVPVDTRGATERPPELRGEVAAAITGTLLSSASPARRSFALTAAPLTDAEDRALRLRVIIRPEPGETADAALDRWVAGKKRVARSRSLNPLQWAQIA